MKAGEIDDPGLVGFFLRSEKDRGREDSLKSLDEASVVWTILGQAEKIEHLGSRIEMDCPAFLLQSEGRNPDGD